MTWVRRLWFALALVALLGAVAILLGAVYGGAGVSVGSVTANGETPTNATANCDGVVVRNVDVTVKLSRRDVSLDNPQLWEVGVMVRATVFESAKQRSITLSPGGEQSVTISFTSVRDEGWAPKQDVEAVVQVVKGNAALAKRTKTVTLQPVEAGTDC